ncbi:DUF3883 domain-containing protein [Sphingopyxis sp. MWB1]|uniref:DUF3883 domain-containing protein n=1 Tax=Sphingopyxis sp. MWB1 TaxID=1537715 RepID=UPI00051A024E|nr:DUF3883 domain-containing protein [Sphingopyxis sp. MWB1]
MTLALSPGLAQAGIALLDLLQRRPLSAADLLSGLPKVGGMSSASALSLAEALAWLDINEAGELQASAAGVQVCDADGYEAALRSILLHYVDTQNPDWLQNATFGRSRVLNFCPVGVRQVFVEAGLAGALDDEVVAFWDWLAAIARGLQKDQLVSIGREGERLTLIHEEARTGAKPRWIAIDSNQDGYDVLSVRATDDRAFLSIEVKASRSGRNGSLHLTRHEWEIALDRPFHLFHLWDLSCAPPRLASVGMDEMAAHVPIDAGAGGWEKVEVPFKAFESLFGPALI